MGAAMSIVLKEESYQVMGSCFEVYKEMGCGFLEAVYQECLELELTARGIGYQAQPTLKLSYKGRPLKQTFSPDFVCFDRVVLEIKAVKDLTDQMRAQVHNYLRVTGHQLGLLVNFAHYPQVEYDRIVY